MKKFPRLDKLWYDDEKSVRYKLFKLLFFKHVNLPKLPKKEKRFNSILIKNWQIYNYLFLLLLLAVLIFIIIIKHILFKLHVFASFSIIIFTTLLVIWISCNYE